MKKKIFAICDPEAEYTRRFCEYIGRKKEYPFEAAGFTSAEKLKAFCQEEDVAVLLISESAYDLSLKELVSGEILLLREEEAAPAGGESVYKYQSCEAVLQEVMCYCAEQGVDTGSRVLRKGQCGNMQLIGLYITAVERDNVRGIINEVLYEKVEAMAVEVVPDKTITQENMVEYGYDWVGMIPLREQAAEKLYDVGVEIFVLRQDNSEATIDSKADITDHAEKGGIFGVEKVAWAKFIEANSIAKVEEMLEDDYGMIDGIINNGSKKEKDVKEADRKSSVMEKLKEKQAVVEKNEAHVPKNKVKSKDVSID